MIGLRGSTVSLFILLIGVFGACGCAEEPEVTRTDEGVVRLGSVQAVDTVNRAVAPNDRQLVLEGIRGSVRLRGADRANAALAFMRRGRGASPEAARSVLEGISITEQGTSGEYVYTWSAAEEDYATVDVRGRVPRRVPLRIDRVGGEVHLVDLKGALTIQHQHGSVDVHGAASRVDVGIQNGDVRVDFQSLPSEGPLQLRTNNGDIRVGLPPNASIRVDARTDVGVVRTRGLSLDTERFAPINAGAQYNGQMGTGGPTLELRTQNGSITLQPADTTQVDSTALTPPSKPTPDTVVPGGAPDTILPDTASVDTISSES